MGKFSKIFHHIESKDLRNKHEQKKAAKLQEEKKKKEFKQYLVSTMETKKYNWREGMTTSDVATINVEKLPGDGNVTVIDTIDSASYEGTTGVIEPGDNKGAFVGTVIRDSGSGNGADGGFNVGGKYLAFQGVGDAFNNARFAVLKAIDSSQVDTITITAIVGNDVNGGEDPDLEAEALFVMYKTPAMERALFLGMPPTGDSFENDDTIIKTPLDGQSGRRTNNGGLNDYSLTIPDYARVEGTQFILYQNFNSGSEFDHFGVTKINFQRKAPMNVVVPLDNPEASSFIRSAPPKSTSTPKKRKKAVDDKLQASDDYTGSRFGDDFPGREVRVGGEDPFASAKIGDDVEPSPQSKGEVKKAFGATQLKTALGKPITSQPADRIAKVTDIVKSKDTVNNPKVSGIQPVQGDFSNIGNGSQGKMPTDFRTLPVEDLDNLFANPTSIEAQEAAVDILAKEIAENKPQLASKFEQLGKAGETFIRYITGTLPDTIDNDFLGEKYVNSMLKNAKIDDFDKFTLNFGDNILGTTQPPVRVGNEIVVPFNYDFKGNYEELYGKDSAFENMNPIMKAIRLGFYNGLGRYSLDGSPKAFGKIIPGLGDLADNVFGAFFSKFIQGGKLLGGSQYRPGELKLNLEQIAKENPEFLRMLWSKGIINQEEFLQLDKGKPLPNYDPYSEKNYKENLPSWFTFRTRTPDGRIFGLNYSGAYGELKPASSRGDRGSMESGYGTKGYDFKNNTGGTLWTMDYDARPGDTPKTTVDPNTPPDPDLALASILGVEKPDKDLAGFKKDAAEKKTEVAVSTEARNSVKSSAEISEMMKGMTAEQKKAAIEKMYPEKAQEILDAADDNVITSALEQGISAVIVDSLADITQPLLGAKTSANAFNEYNDFLGKVVKNPNTPGATYENPVNMSNQITKGDMNDLTTTINSGNYQSIVNSIKATNDKDAQKRLKGELEAMIKETIQGNFGLDNFLHNNVKVDLDHLLETGKTKLTKGYKFTTGGTISGVEDATSFKTDGMAYGAKLIADALGLEYDTLGAGNTAVEVFAPAIVAKLGLTNTKNFDNSSYKSPMMYYEVDVPGKYSVDSKGNTIQSAKPSAAEQIKQTVSNILDKGKEVVSNMFSFGNEDENAPQREDFPMGRSGAKKFSDAMKLYDAAKSVSELSNKPYEEPQLDPRQKFGMRDLGSGPAMTDLMALLPEFGGSSITPEASDLPVIPPSDEVAALIAAAKSGGDADINALAKAHAEMMEKQLEAMYKAELGGASPESLSALSVRQYLARKPLEDALEIDSPVPPMPSEPIEPQREDYPNTRSGAKQYQDAKKAFDAKQASKEISELSNDDAQNRVFDIFDQDSETASALYDPLYENDPVYKEYMGIYDEMEKNATPEGQELLKQQYEALEFTLQGYASEFVDTVLVQPGGMNPFGYENTSNQALTYAGKKDAPAGVYFWDMSEREQFEKAGIDLAKYDEARALLDTYADDFDYKITDYIFAQPEHIEADAEVDRTMAIYQASSNTSKSAWASYEAHADKYAGREFILPLEQAEYERVTKRAEELYKTYEEAENKSYDDMNLMLDANTKRGDIFTKYMNKIDDAGDMVDGAKEKRIEYWDNYEQELKSNMEVIKSKINGDYDYNEDLRALDPQIEELFNRVNRQFLMLYNNRDDILGTFGTDEIGKPEFDPFKDEIKPGLGAEDGDELASSLSGGSYGNSYDVGGGDFRGIDQIIRMYNDPKGSEKYGDRMMKNIEQIMLDLDLVKKPKASSDPRSSIAGLGGDDASSFSFDGTQIAGYPNSFEQSILRNQLNSTLKSAGYEAAKREQERLLKMYGIFFPLASGNNSNAMVAHFVPRGKNLSEVMLVKKTKLQRPKQFFKEPNQFFNVNDIKPEFPENPPPKLDPKTGKHPEYGKKANRYKKLDPISANSMPPTGDPEIDAVVNKQKTINKIKKMARNK